MFQSVQEETFRVAQEGTGLSIGGTSSPREGQDFGAVSMGPAIDHKGLDTGLERKSMLHIALLQFPLLTPGQFVDRPSYFLFSKGPCSRLC